MPKTILYHKHSITLDIEETKAKKANVSLNLKAALRPESIRLEIPLFSLPNPGTEEANCVLYDG